jgi:hypothetical protein
LAAKAACIVTRRRDPSSILFALMLVAARASATCGDGVRNGDESDVDCGGECPACERGNSCRVPTDCYSGRCAAWICEERSRPKGTAVPLGYRVEQSEADGAAIARNLGWVSLGVGYGTAYVAALSLPGEVSWLYAPVVGPWVTIAHPGQHLRGLLVVDALLQTLGAGLLVGGIATGGEQLVRDEPTTARLRVTPVVTASGGAVWVHGFF